MSQSAERILAIDFGMRRLGLAVSDPLGITAQGLPTLERRNLAADVSALEALAGQYAVREIVLGHPISKSGEASAISRRVEEFAARLRARLGIEVKLWDERLTSAEAQRLLRDSGASVAQRRRAVDRIAAVLILQSYLDWRSSGARQEGDLAGL